MSSIMLKHQIWPLRTNGVRVCKRAIGGRGNPLSTNSSKTAWNFQTSFYRMDTDTLRMVYVNFHKPICIRDFSVGRGGSGRRIWLSLNSSETAWNFQTSFYRMEAGSMRMVYVNFHKHICPRDFSVIADFSARISQKPLAEYQQFFDML